MMFRMTTLISRADVQKCGLLLRPVESSGGPMFRSTEPDLVQKNHVHVKFCLLEFFFPLEFKDGSDRPYHHLEHRCPHRS
ncbi:hypothetical protein NC653_031767 [Populus alba x Populus x berolinensis]|uniref:Uncharacterized protein n=1 Tax=Populus alba x Populus x berolinensis TaxID=444605 RepID=A0AAD6M248_9ROSI|nr:hypothetical protein NC653_031767 [Populus alba x Populus x berolinensis]